MRKRESMKKRIDPIILLCGTIALLCLFSRVIGEVVGKAFSDGLKLK